MQQRADDEAAYADDTKVKRSVEQQEVFPLPGSKEPVSVIEDEKLTVMVIDDDTEIALYLKTLLSPYYKVICRFDADSAIKTMKENAPDCILCDGQQSLTPEKFRRLMDKVVPLVELMGKTLT